MTSLRPDGHRFNVDGSIGGDCLHYLLPSVIDSWALMFYNALISKFGDVELIETLTDSNATDFKETVSQAHTSLDKRRDHVGHKPKRGSVITMRTDHVRF